MSNILLIVRKKIIYIPHQWCQLKPENQRKRLRGFVECQVNRQIKGRQSSDLEATFHLRERLLEVPPKKTQKNPTTETLVFRCQKRGRPVLFFFFEVVEYVVFFFVWEGEIWGLVLLGFCSFTRR